jgi:hypothetical protein
MEEFVAAFKGELGKEALGMMPWQQQQHMLSGCHGSSSKVVQSREPRSKAVVPQQS